MDELTIKNHKSDIQAILNCLNKVIDNKTKQVELYANSKIWVILLEREKELLSIANQCKENLSFIYDVLDHQLLDSEIIKSNMGSKSYSPRKIVFTGEIGKYRTETHKIKRDFDTLLWVAKNTGSTEREEFLGDCIKKLNYVYSNIAKLEKF